MPLQKVYFTRMTRFIESTDRLAADRLRLYLQYISQPSCNSMDLGRRAMLNDNSQATITQTGCEINARQAIVSTAL